MAKNKESQNSTQSLIDALHSEQSTIWDIDREYNKLYAQDRVAAKNLIQDPSHQEILCKKVAAFKGKDGEDLRKYVDQFGNVKNDIQQTIVHILDAESLVQPQKFNSLAPDEKITRIRAIRSAEERKSGGGNPLIDPLLRTLDLGQYYNAHIENRIAALKTIPTQEQEKTEKNILKSIYRASTQLEHFNPSTHVQAFEIASSDDLKQQCKKELLMEDIFHGNEDRKEEGLFQEKDGSFAFLNFLKKYPDTPTLGATDMGIAKVAVQNSSKEIQQELAKKMLKCDQKVREHPVFKSVWNAIPEGLRKNAIAGGLTQGSVGGNSTDKQANTLKANAAKLGRAAASLFGSGDKNTFHTSTAPSTNRDTPRR